MEKDERILWGLLIAAALLSLFALLYALTPVAAQDILPNVCRNDNSDSFTFHIPPEWNNPDLPSWWAWGNSYQMVDATTIIVTAAQEVEIYGEGFPQWEQDLRVGQALVGSGDYSIILTADENTAVCGSAATITLTPTQNAAKPLVALNYPILMSTPVPVSTGRTCIVHYPQIVLVCNKERP